MLKNVASQKLTVFAYTPADGLPKTGDAANLTAYVDIDDAGIDPLADTSATEVDSTNAKGFYIFDVAQAETNGIKLAFSGKSSTSGVVVLACPSVIYTDPPNYTLLSIGASGETILTSAYDAAKTAAQAGDAMALTSGERTTLTAVIWNALTSGMSTVGSIGKKLADWVVGTIDTYTGNTKQTGDAYPVVSSVAHGNAALKALIDAFALYTTRVVVRATVGAASTDTSIVTSAFAPAGVAADQFKGRVVVFDNDTTTTSLRGQATVITASSAAATPVLTVTALTTAPVSGDTFSVL